MKKNLLFLFIIIISIFLTGCVEQYSNKFNETEEERTLNGVIYERAYQVKRTIGSRRSKRTKYYYYIFDEDEKKFLLNYGGEDFCGIYEGKYEGELDSKEGVTLYSDVPDENGFHSFKARNNSENQTHVEYALFKIKMCIEENPNSFHRYKEG